MSGYDDYEVFLRESMTPMHEIEPRLFLGNMTAAENEDLLRSHRITCIVQCLENRGLVPHFSFIKYQYVPVDDMQSENIARYLPDAIRFINQRMTEGETVLVHCAAGVSRSSSVVIAFYMAKYNIGFEEAKGLVKAKRGCVFPNAGFERQLKAFRKEELRSFLH